MASRKTTASTATKTARKRTTKAKAPVPETTAEDMPEDFSAEMSALAAPEDIPGAEPAAPVAEDDAPIPTKLVKKDLVDRVVARSGVKPRFVRQVTDALLHELGVMIEDADTLQLQPLGNVKVQRRKPVEGGDVVICKIRRKKDQGEGNDPLAAAAE